jgi:hypothetical protein
VEQCVLRSDVAQTSPPPDGFAAGNKSAVSLVSKPAAFELGRCADLEIGDTAGLETCATSKNKTAAARVSRGGCR